MTSSTGDIELLSYYSRRRNGLLIWRVCTVYLATINASIVTRFQCNCTVEIRRPTSSQKISSDHFNSSLIILLCRKRSIIRRRQTFKQTFMQTVGLSPQASFSRMVLHWSNPFAQIWTVTCMQVLHSQFHIQFFLMLPTIVSRELVNQHNVMVKDS